MNALKSYNQADDGFIKITKLSNLEEKIGKRFFINQVDVALFKVEGDVFALNNVCPHMHSAIIYDGFIEDDYVVCPAHGWKFNLLNGKQPQERSGVDSYEVRTVDGFVWVKVPKKSDNW